MKISGFSFIRNAIKFDYPIKESILSILPLCDEFVVCIGNSDDNTLELIESINSRKIKIVHSVWDDNLRIGGQVLAIETNKAFSSISKESDWAFYIQGDEVVHESDHTIINDSMQKYLENKKVEGLLFKYKHFYGSYDYIADSRSWYRNEIRVIRNDKRIKSYQDAQGFRIENRKLKVKPIEATIYHYGWVKNPIEQQLKQKTFHRYWHPDEWLKKNIKSDNKYDYSNIDSLELFKGTHPSVMIDRIKKMDWEFNYNGKKKLNLRKNFLYKIEKLTGKRFFEYKNYEQI